MSSEAPILHSWIEVEFLDKISWFIAARQRKSTIYAARDSKQVPRPWSIVILVDGCRSLMSYFNDDIN